MLINRKKFVCIGDENSPYKDFPSLVMDYPKRVYASPSNFCKMTMLEFMWLYPETNTLFGKHRKSNIWWFLLLMFYPTIDNIYYQYKEDIMDWRFVDVMGTLLTLLIALCGLGPLHFLLIAYCNLKREKQIVKRNNFKEYEKYKKIRFI